MMIAVGLFSAMRVVLGLAPIIAAGPASRLLGFPAEHDNATSRLMGRLFGVRDIGLGVIGFAGLQGVVPLGFALLFNAVHDVGDAMVIAAPLIGRHGIDRAAGQSLALAVLGSLCWLVAWVVLVA